MGVCVCGCGCGGGGGGEIYCISCVAPPRDGITLLGITQANIQLGCKGEGHVFVGGGVLLQGRKVPGGADIKNTPQLLMLSSTTQNFF